MDILSALKTEASKLQQQLDTLSHKSFGRKEQRRSRQRSEEEAAFLRCFKGENGSEAKGEVGKNKSCEEECLTILTFETIGGFASSNPSGACHAPNNG